MVYGLNGATAKFFCIGAIVQRHKSVILQVSYQYWMPMDLGWRIMLTSVQCVDWVFQNIMIDGGMMF